MTFPERHRVEELVSLYQLEPTIRDLYVEGDTDEAFFDWFFDQAGLQRIEVKGIDSVEVPAELVAQYGYEINNRGRLIALAHELERHLGPGPLNVTCVADADFDLVLGTRHSCSLLLLTDYAALELYSFTPSTLSKLFKLVVRGFPKSGEDVIAAIRTPLAEAFAIRMTNKVLGWNLAFQPIEKCCTLVADTIRFDTREYIDRHLRANDRFGQKHEFTEALEKCRLMLTGDERRFIHGHDFVDLLAWYIRQHKGFKSTQTEAVGRALFACTESASLAQEPMLRHLLLRMRPE